MRWPSGSPDKPIFLSCTFRFVYPRDCRYYCITLAHPSMPDSMFTAPRIASRSSDTLRTSRRPRTVDSPDPSRPRAAPLPAEPRSTGPGDASLRIASSAVRAAPRAILRPLSLSANAEFSRISLISRTDRWVLISPSLASRAAAACRRVTGLLPRPRQDTPGLVTGCWVVVFVFWQGWCGGGARAGGVCRSYLCPLEGWQYRTYSIGSQKNRPVPTHAAKIQGFYGLLHS